MSCILQGLLEAQQKCSGEGCDRHSMAIGFSTPPRVRMVSLASTLAHPEGPQRPPGPTGLPLRLRPLAFRSSFLTRLLLRGELASREGLPSVPLKTFH